MDLDTAPSEDDELGVYIPLQRPPCNIEPMNQQSEPEKIDYSVGDVSSDSSSDDSDNPLKRREKMKRKLSPDLVQPTRPVDNAAKKKKYSVWSDMLQEEAIENQFVDTEFFDRRCRGNETYDYRMKFFQEGGSKNCRNELRKIVKAHSKPRAAKKSLTLPDLETTVDDTAENIALEIAKHLNEPKTELIERVVNALGKQKAIDIYKQTKEAEQNGGILTLNGARRRTSGGVYLKFVKDQKLSRKEYDAIFNYSDDFNKNAYKPKHKSKAKAKATKEKSLKDLPLRHELEILNSSDKSDGSVMKKPPKNPPPSPENQLPSSSTSPFPLGAQFSPCSENGAFPQYYAPMSPTGSPNMPRYSPGSSPTERLEMSPSYNQLPPDELVYES